MDIVEPGYPEGLWQDWALHLWHKQSHLPDGVEDDQDLVFGKMLFSKRKKDNRSFVRKQ
jgi:hypothetical protein